MHDYALFKLLSVQQMLPSRIIKLLSVQQMLPSRIMEFHFNFFWSNVKNGQLKKMVGTDI